MAFQRSRRSHREFYGVMADPPWAGGRAVSLAGSRMPVETPSQRDPAAAHEEHGVAVFFGFCFYKFGEYLLAFPLNSPKTKRPRFGNFPFLEMGLGRWVCLPETGV